MAGGRAERPGGGGAGVAVEKRAAVESDLRGGVVDLVGFEPTTSSMPWTQSQSLTAPLTRNKRLPRQRIGPHLDPTRSSMRDWTSKGPYSAKSGSGHAVRGR